MVLPVFKIAPQAWIRAVDGFRVRVPDVLQKFTFKLLFMKFNKEQCEYEFAKLPIELQRFIVATIHELNGAVHKHPEWPADLINGAAIVAEESGELVRASLQYNY